MPSDLILSGRRAIRKEIVALTTLENGLGDNFVLACEKLFACRGTVVLTGMGKSGLVARKWASTLSSTGTAAYFLNAAEASHGDLGILRKDDVLVALSFSGETEELANVLRHASQNGVDSIAVTGGASSSLARQVSLVLSVDISEEACPLGLAPTASTTVMMALGDAIAVALMEMRGFTEQDFARLHPGGTLGRRLWLRVGELMHRGDSIPVVGPRDPFAQVLLEMTRKRLGLAVVKDGEKVLGIVTDGDLRRFFQVRDSDPAKAAAARAVDMMTTTPKTISSDALAVEARELMERNRIQHLLILGADGVLQGVVHLQDLLQAKVV